jgi:hypothetical protein
MTEKKTEKSDNPNVSQTTSPSTIPPVSIISQQHARDVISNHPAWRIDQFYAAHFPEQHDPEGNDHRCPECLGPLELNETQAICHGKCEDESKSVKHIWDFYRLVKSQANDPVNYRTALIQIGSQIGFATAPDKCTAEQKERQRSLLTAALFYASLGFHIVPLHHIVCIPIAGTNEAGRPITLTKRECSCEAKRRKKTDKSCGSPGKHPIPYHGLKEASTDRAQIIEWWSTNPEANIAIVTGQKSNLWVLDVDEDEGYANIRELESTHGTLPDTITAITGSGGLHYYFAHPTDATLIRGSASQIAPHIDVRGYEGYVVAPPSNHMSGTSYQWEAGSEPNEISLAPAPQWLIDLVTKAVEPSTPLHTASQRTKSGKQTLTIHQPDHSTPRSFSQILQGVPEGQRDREIFRFACSRLARGLSIAEIKPLVLIAASECTPPFPESEALAKINAAVQTHRTNHPDWQDPEYNPGEVPDVPPQPETTSEAQRLVNTMITIAQNSRKADIDLPSLLFTPTNISAVERVRAEDSVLFSTLNLALKRHNLSRDLDIELRRRQICIAPASGQKQPTYLVSKLNALNITPPTHQAPLTSTPLSQLLVIPDPYTFDQDGIGIIGYDSSGNLERSPVAPSLCFPISISKNIFDHTEAVTLVYLKNNSWHYVTTERENAVDASRIVQQVAAQGGPVSSHNAKILARFIFEYLAANTPNIPVTHETSQLGWLPDGSGFLVGNTLVTPKNNATRSTVFRPPDSGNIQIAQAFQSAGSMTAWLSAMERLTPYPIPRITIAASLAAPLLRLLNAESFGIDLACKTSRGKTFTATLAARVWGQSNRTTHSLISPWNVTVVAAERRAAMLSGLPLIMDDSREANPRIIDAIIYGLTNGSSRSRGSRRGLSASTFWQTILISTGESPLTSLSRETKDGKNVRIITLSDLPFHKADESTLALINELESLTSSNYGLAGPHFIQHILSLKSQNRAELDDIASRYRDLSTSYATTLTGESSRVARHCAVIALATQLAQEAGVLPASWESNPFLPLFPVIFAAFTAKDQATAALFDIYEWCVKNSPSFQGQADHDKRRPQYGVWDESNGPWAHINIFPRELRTLLHSCGYDYEAVIADWTNNDWVSSSQERKGMRRVKHNQRVNWYVSIKKTAFEVANVIPNPREPSNPFDVPF